MASWKRLANVASDLSALAAAAGALEAVLVDMDPVKALAAAPPLLVGVALGVPVPGVSDPTLLNVLAMEAAVVVSEVVSARKGAAGPAALGVVAVVGLLLVLRAVNLLVMSV